jgi:hypothetical protein
MTIIDSYVALTLLALVVAASAAVVAVLGVALTRVAADQRRRRLARHESIPTYYRRAALGH